MIHILIYHTQEDTNIYNLGHLVGEELMMLDRLDGIVVNVDDMTPMQQKSSVQLVAMLSDRPYEDDDISDPSLFCKWKDKKLDMKAPLLLSDDIRIFKTGFFL